MNQTGLLLLGASTRRSELDPVVQHSFSTGLDNAFLEDYFVDHVVPATNERKKVIETLNPDLETLLNLLNAADSRFPKDAIRVGSSYQGLKVERSDEFDFTVYLNNITIDGTWGRRSGDCGCFYGFQFATNMTYDEAEFMRMAHTAPQKLPDGTETRLHNEVNETRGIVPKPRPLDPPSVGYINISLNEQSFWDLTFPRSSFSLLSPRDLVPFLVKRRLKILLTDIVQNKSGYFRGKFSKSPTFHGPALTVHYDHPNNDISFPIGLDISPAVRCTWSFERLGVDWPRRNSRWPPEDITQRIRQKGVLYVAKRNFYWRLSFAECEKVLCKHCDSDGGCRKKVHRLMKYFHKKIWWPQRKPEISSFVVKNVWMLEMERLPNEEDWKQDKLNVRLFGCIRSLLDYVYGFIHHASPLPQYFNPADNLLDGKDKPQLKKEYDKILYFYRNPREYFH